MLTRRSLRKFHSNLFTFANRSASHSQEAVKHNALPELRYNGQVLQFDDYTNVTPNILKHVGKNLYLQKYHPLFHVRNRIIDYFYKTFLGPRGNPVFSVYYSPSPIVTVEQNFDSLLIPKTHPSYSRNDCYFINTGHLLRAHTTAHQAELVQSGLNNFLIIGDVYRRDQIDFTHYPVFHQVDTARLQTQAEVFPEGSKFLVFEKRPDKRTQDKQEVHTIDATQIIEHQLKSTLLGLAIALFGTGVDYRWVDAYFPFTHPSWELEIKHDGKWLELLGCGIMEHKILARAGAADRIGWAFGLGLERLAMHIYQIPDIRLFWSTDSGFLSQFAVEDPCTHITYKPVSMYPQCTNDLSFWLPKNREYCSNDLYDIARDIGGDLIEQIYLFDEFTHPKKQQKSHAYRIVYRHMERTLTQKEVNEIHNKISQTAAERLHVTIRGPAV